jgi:hypothetical protein
VLVVDGEFCVDPPKRREQHDEGYQSSLPIAPSRFKIQQDGYDAGTWATSKVIDNGGIHAITIPSCIAPGQYLLRAEMIALHAASSSGGAQLYME